MDIIKKFANHLIVELGPIYGSSLLLVVEL